MIRKIDNDTVVVIFTPEEYARKMESLPINERIPFAEQVYKYPMISPELAQAGIQTPASLLSFCQKANPDVTENFYYLIEKS